MNDSKLTVRVLRQDHSDKPNYWQTFQIRREPSMNVTSVLQRIAMNPTTIEGTKVAPVAYESGCLEEVCGKAGNCQAVCPKKIPLMTELVPNSRTTDGAI